MQNIRLELEAETSKSFLATKAANSVSLNIGEKAKHKISIGVDFPDGWNIGVICGSSGSGKTTLAGKLFGEFYDKIDPEKAIIDQFEPELSYEEITKTLIGIGLTSVPCWIKPVKCLSNGQRYRAIAALAIQSKKEICVLDEFTSVVDRQVASIMSQCVAKYARKNNRKLVLCSCHFDILEDLSPDWLIDCNKQEFITGPEYKKKHKIFTSRKQMGICGDILANITI